MAAVGTSQLSRLASGLMMGFIPFRDTFSSDSIGAISTVPLRRQEHKVKPILARIHIIYIE